MAQNKNSFFFNFAWCSSGSFLAAFILVDCGDYVFMWQGPFGSDCNDNHFEAVNSSDQPHKSSFQNTENENGDKSQSSPVGPVGRRFMEERKQAFETILKYCKGAGS